MGLPAAAAPAKVKVRFRAPEGHRLRSVTASGKLWDQFNAEEETVTLPSAAKRHIELTIQY